MRLSDIENAARAERQRLGYDAEVSAHMEGEQIMFTTGDARHRSHALRDAGLIGVAAASSEFVSKGDLEGLRHGLYLAQRSISDVHALKSGRLPQRVVRRAVSKRVMRGLWGN
jgi:hypothetical protein